MYWNEKPYHALDYHLKTTYGQKLYKLSLDGGMSCPNRDGTIGSRGCTFCSPSGSGDFAASQTSDLERQIELAKAQVQHKNHGGNYIAYFQSYSNTYGAIKDLTALFTKVIERPEVIILSLATRPDCLPEEVIQLLIQLNQQKPVWIELGLQTIHEDTALMINRGYALPTFELALNQLKAAGITVIVHIILGLPGEDRNRNLQTIDYLNQLGIQGIKLHLLHILKGTELAAQYQRQPFPIMSLDQYSNLLIDCICQLSPDIVIHRITGDGPKAILLEPQWSQHKKLVLNTIHRRFRERQVYQGIHYCPAL